MLLALTIIRIVRSSKPRDFRFGEELSVSFLLI
jgi:hypothetical protein